MRNDKGSGGAGMVGGAIAVVLILVAVLNKGGNSPTAPTSGRPTGMTEAEYNYVNGRLRQEGANSEEADKATRAIWQFEQARRAREGK